VLFLTLKNLPFIFAYSGAKTVRRQIVVAKTPTPKKCF